MLWENITLIAIGFIALILGSRLAIKSLVAMSRHYGVPEFVISFLLVGVVAILPELSIGINSALAGKPSFGLGVIFGSNIADLTLIVGLVALASGGIHIHKFAHRQLRIFAVATLLPVLLLIDGELSKFDGGVLVACFIAYVMFMFSERKRWRAKFVKKERTNIFQEIAVLVFALIVLFAAGNFITDNALALSAELAAPLFFIGIMVAIGTCLPELNFAIQAARSKHEELGFGDIIGNVLADCMLTVGIIAIISPIRPAFPALALISGTIMFGCMALLIFLFRKNSRITRNQGFGLVLLYLLIVLSQLIVEENFFHL